ncbi:hypothetical protein [Methylorubrum aminovorans]
MAEEQRDQSSGAAVSPKDPATGQLKSQHGPMERAGTEAEEAARGNTKSGERKTDSGDDRSA